jgi:DNA invertase Pin-like site-specific DNA recombinase
MATQDSNVSLNSSQSPTKALRVAIYARVSTDMQSVDMQLDALHQYCGNRGWDIHQVYSDQGISGTKVKRPALDQLMADARKRKFDCVLVWAFDRFARSTKHLLMALEEFKSVGIQFVSYQQNIDTAGPFGEFFFTVVAAFGQLERAMIVERVRSGLAAAKARGVRLGRRNTVVNTARVEILRGSGLSWGKVAAELGVSIPTIQKAMHALAADAAAVPSAGALTVLCNLREDA